MKQWKLSELGGWPTVSTYFPHTDSEITEMSESGPSKILLYYLFLTPFSSWLHFHVIISFCDLQKDKEQGGVTTEFELDHEMSQKVEKVRKGGGDQCISTENQKLQNKFFWLFEMRGRGGVIKDFDVDQSAWFNITSFWHKCNKKMPHSEM